VGKGDTLLFSGSAVDQFGAALVPEPSFAWSVNGGGTVAVDGVFTATMVGGPFTVTASSGNLAGDASVTITGETLSHWRSSFFSAAEMAAGSADDFADADGDGLPNFLEYALGLNPRAPGSLPAASLDGNGHLSLTLMRPKGLPGVVYTGEATDHLGTWPTTIPAEILQDGDPQTIRFTDPAGLPGETQRFLRVRVTKP
jgi:hypothetical protein